MRNLTAESISWSLYEWLDAEATVVREPKRRIKPDLHRSRTSTSIYYATTDRSLRVWATVACEDDGIDLIGPYGITATIPYEHPEMMKLLSEALLKLGIEVPTTCEKAAV